MPDAQLGADVGQLVAHSVSVLPAWHSPGLPPLPPPPSVPVPPPAPPFAVFVVLLPFVVSLPAVAVAAALVVLLLALPFVPPVVVSLALVPLALVPLVEAVVLGALVVALEPLVAPELPPASAGPLSASFGPPQLSAAASNTPTQRVRVRRGQCADALGAIMLGCQVRRTAPARAFACFTAALFWSGTNKLHSRWSGRVQTAWRLRVVSEEVLP